MSAAIGTLGRYGIGASSPVDTCQDIMSEDLVLNQESINGNGVRGTRSHTVERVRAGLQRIGGPVRMQPSAADYHALLPWALGANAATISGTNKRYDLAETLPSRYVTIDRHAKVFTYATVGVQTFTLRAGQGQMAEVELGLLASTETVANAGTFPAIYPDVTTNAFVLSDLVLTVGGTTVTPQSFELTVNNDLDPDRFFNSNTLTALVSRDREVMFKTRLPYGDATALYNTGAGTGVAVAATFTQGSWVMTISMQKVVFPPRSPAVAGREEVMLDLEGRAYRHGTATDSTKAELIFTLDTGV